MHTIAAVPVALILFDLLLEDGEDLRSLPLVSRRAQLEDVFHGHQSNAVRLSRIVPDNGRGLLEEAKKLRWEGLSPSGRTHPTGTESIIPISAS